MTENKNSKEKDLKEAIENRTEDPDELLDPEDIDADASDIEVETKPETVAWEFTAIVKTDKKEFEHKAGKLGKNPPEVPEKMSDEIRDKEPLIRRKDAEDEKNKCYEAGYKNGKRQGKKDALKLIGNKIQNYIKAKISIKDFLDKNPTAEHKDTLLNDLFDLKSRQNAMEKLKQKIKDGEE